MPAARWFRFFRGAPCLALLCVHLLAFVPAARADEEAPSCAHPQAAASSLLDWLQPERYDPEKAATCLDLPPDLARRGSQVAVQLKQVLDARGLYVPTGELPADPDYTDEKGQHRVVPLDTAPSIYLVKKGDRWLYSRETINATPKMYRETFSSFALSFQKVLPRFFFGRIFGLFYWQYLFFVLLVGVSFAGGRIVHRLLSAEALRLARRIRLPLDAQTYARMRGPITWATAAGIFYWGIPDLHLGVRSTQMLSFLAQVTLSFSVVAVIYRLVDVLEGVMSARAEATEGKLDDQLVPLVSRMIKGLVVILGVVFVLQNQGVDVASLLAGLGLGGLAFALAAKDTVENLFGSITIFIDRPFQIGDWIIVGGEVEGVVEEVGIRSTRIRTFGQSLVSVPNGKVANSSIDNMGQRPYRRITTTIGVRYDTARDQVHDYVERLNRIIAEHPETWKGTVQIHFKDFGPSALEIMIYFFLEVDTWHRELRARQEIFLEFMAAAEDLGVQFAFPSTSVYLEPTAEGTSPLLPGPPARP